MAPTDLLPVPGGAAAALRDPDHPLATLMRMTLCGIIITRWSDGVLVAVNDAFVTSIGATREEVLGLTTAEVDLYVDPDMRARIYAALDRGGFTRMDVGLRHRDGRTVATQLTASLVHLGGEACALGFFEDVTELHRLDAARRDTEAELATMFELAPVGLVEAEAADGRIVRVNPAMTELTGFSEDELLERSIPDLSPPAARDQDHARWAAIRRGEATSGQHRKRYLCKDGSLRWVDVRWRTMDLGRRTGPRVVAVVADVTAQQAAESERRLLTTALHAADNAIVITDTDGTIRWVNQAFTRLTGYTAEEAIGGSPSLLRSGVQDDAFYRQMWATIGGGEIWRGELVNRRKDGGLYHEDMTITPVREDGGAITHHIAIKQDITARKRVDAARVEAEQRYRLALDASGLGTWQHDLETDRLECDARAQEHFGLPRPTASLAEVLALIHPDDRRNVDALVAQARGPTAPDRQLGEQRMLRADGEIRWLAINSRVIQARETRQPRSVIATTRDITESKRAADALRASEDRYRNLVDNLDDVMFSVDAVGRFTFVSSAIGKFGYRPDELIGHPMDEFIHPDDRPLLLRDFRTRLAGQPAPPTELRWLDATGKVRILRASPRPLVIDGMTIGITGLATDITSQRDTEEQLRQVQRMEAIGRLAGGVAHDFNNLLSVITSYSELAMAELRAEDPMHADLQQIAEAAQRAAGLTRQLLAFSRRQILQPELVDLGELIAGLSKMLRRLIGEDVLLQVDVDDGLGTIRVDRGQLEQVVMNLAVNARDAMPDGGSLRIAARNAQVSGCAAAHLEIPTGDYVELEVIDTGCGMTHEVQARIFEPFFTTKPTGKGTGLGLSMVHGIVKQSGGGIAVESAPGRGTTFRIVLPRTDGEVRTADSGMHALMARQVRGHERILVVEDEAALRGVTRRLLSAAGYHVEVAANAGEALLVCEDRGHTFDLVLTDVVMPGMSGRKLAERLSMLCPAAKVMFMSGYTDEMLAQHDVLQHAFIRKPFDRATLTAKVRNVLDAGGA